MRVVILFCVALVFGPAAAFADQAGPAPEIVSSPTGKVTSEQIRSGAIIDDGLRIPHIRAGTQYFEIHGSTRVSRALGDDRLATGKAGIQRRLASDRGAGGKQSPAAR